MQSLAKVDVDSWDKGFVSAQGTWRRHHLENPGLGLPYEYFVAPSVNAVVPHRVMT